MEKSLKEFAKRYIDSTDLFTQLIPKLEKNERKGDKKEAIIISSHEMNVISVINSDNHHLIHSLLEKDEIFAKIFEKRLERKLVNHLLDTKLWFCLKYKNLPQNRNIKSLDELKANKMKVFSIDCLQIVSLSQTSEALIGRKFVPKRQEESDEGNKWCLKRFRDLNETSVLSADYREDTDRRVFTQKRQFLAILGSKVDKNAEPFEITVFLEIFDERQLQCIYNGSHLSSVVLLDMESTYLLLSFDKICGPVPQLIGDFNQYLLQFPPEVRALYNDRKVSNYSFALSLAFIFGDNISISGSFFRLKLGLLLSVLSLNEYPKKNHSSVLVLCDDTLMIRRLFEWSSLFSEYRYLLKSCSVPMTGKGRHKCLNWTDSGALQLGADGITIIGSVSNLNELSDKERTALFHALDANEVIARQSQPSVPSLTEFELKSTIWAVIDDNIDERQFQQKTNRSQTIHWTQVFGMVYRIPKSAHNYIYSGLPTEGTLTFDEWHTVIALMGRIRPQMTEMAETLLQHYYLSIRQIRGSKLNHISLHSLISLSISLAKLSLRLEVTKYDALMTILLYEESMTTRLSERESPLGVNPIFHVLVHEMSHFIGSDCDHQMAVFENNLMEFLSKQMPTFRTNSLKQYFSQNEE